LAFTDQKNIQILMKNHFSHLNNNINNDKIIENLIYLPFTDLAEDELFLGNVKDRKIYMSTKFQSWLSNCLFIPKTNSKYCSWQEEPTRFRDSKK